jgi:ABC-2 type transport system ATP-binding protein
MDMQGNNRNYTVEVKGIKKSFGEIPAVLGVDLQVHQGDMIGLIGPDGAGKTTLLRMLCGLLVPDEGKLSVLGFDPVRELDDLKQDFGYMPQRFSLYPDLTVSENMRFFADIYGLSKAQRRERTDRLLKFSQLDSFTDRKAGDLSGGMKQKLALSCTLIHTPKLLILDEPTTGVDPVSREEFWMILSELKAQGVTILVTTPYMDEAAQCDGAALMYGGKILAQGTPDQLVARFPHHLICVYTPEARHAAAILQKEESFLSVELYGDRVHIAVDDPEEGKRRVENILRTLYVPFTSVEIGEPGLEDAFVFLVKKYS